MVRGHRSDPSVDDVATTLASRLGQFRKHFSELGFSAEEFWKWLSLAAYYREDDSMYQEVEAALRGEVVPPPWIVAIVMQMLNQQRRLAVENAKLEWSANGDRHSATIKGIEVHIARTSGRQWQIALAKRNDIDIDFSFAHPDLATQKRKAAMYVDYAIEDSLRRGLGWTPTR